LLWQIVSRSAAPIRRGLPWVAACVLLLASACRPEPSHGTGSARISVSLSFAGWASAIDQVLLTVSPGGGPTFAPIQAVLQRSDQLWSAYLGAVPAGASRQFDLVARDGQGQVLCVGSGRADITAGGTALVSMVLQPPPPAAFRNSGPAFDFLAASASNVVAGQKVKVEAEAHDPDGGPVGLLWSASCGVFETPNSATTNWIPPSGGQSRCRLTVTASDSYGSSATAEVTITITPQGGYRYANCGSGSTTAMRQGAAAANAVPK
jgi:hypothetical protein